jgi:hypothetical protein
MEPLEGLRQAGKRKHVEHGTGGRLDRGIVTATKSMVEAAFWAERGLAGVGVWGG